MGPKELTFSLPSNWNHKHVININHKQVPLFSLLKSIGLENFSSSIFRLCYEVPCFLLFAISLYLVFFCGHTQLMMEMLKVCAASMCALEVYLPKENFIFGIVMSL